MWRSKDVSDKYEMGVKERPEGLVKNENFELIKEEVRDIQDGEGSYRKSILIF